MKKFFLNIKKMFNILSVIYRTSKSYFYIVMATNIISSFLPFISLIYTNLIIDALLNKEEVKIIYEYVIWLISLNLIIGITIQILNYFKQVHMVKFQYQLDNLIAIKSFELDYGQIESNDVMKLIKRAEEGSNSSGGMVNYANLVLGNILTSIFSIINASVILTGALRVKELTTTSLIAKIVNHPLTGAFLFLVVMIICIFNLVIMNNINKKSYEAMMGNIDGNRKFGYFYNICSNYKYGKDIRIYGMQPMIIERMSDQQYSVDNVWRSYSLYNIKWQTVITFMSKFLAFLAYAYVGIKAIYGLISIGNVVAYASAITIFASHLNTFIYTYEEISLRNNYLDNYFEFLNLKNDISYGKEEIDENESIEIEFKDLSFAYPHQDLTLKDINLKINKGEKLALVGSNGAGKTTLIKLLCRLYEPTNGDILINGKSLSSYSKESCYKIFSIVFQDFKLFSYSIKDNVASGMDANEEEVWNALEKSGIKERVLEMEDKLDTIIYQRNKKNGVEISGGEAQKFAIARALYKNAPLVILDEPTAALDPKSEAEIYEKFQELVQNKTSIFISHRLSSCKFCDRIVVLDNGKIIEVGTHKELINKNGMYAKMWNAQAQYYL
ncbi:MAG TPA: ABC transporter ATP-binding protein [Bacilli bacterium]